MFDLSSNNIKEAAEATSTTLKMLGYDSCVTGSVACMLWGMRNRTPNDVDMVVLRTDIDLEAIKRSIVEYDSRFILVNSKNPFATYKVLWYQYSEGTYFRKKRCKVDILKPGDGLAIPFVPGNKLYKARGYCDDIRVMPFIPVLLLKVQAWSHHDTSDKLHYRQKVPQDVRDIEELLGIAERGGYKLKDVKNWLPDWIQAVGKGHVEQYKKAYPHSSRSWAAIMR